MVTYNGSQIKYKNSKYEIEGDTDIGALIKKTIKRIKKTEPEDSDIDIKDIKINEYSYETKFNILSDVIENYINIYILYSVNEKKVIL